MSTRQMSRLPGVPRRRDAAVVTVLVLGSLGAGPAAVLVAQPAAAQTGSVILVDGFRGSTTDSDFIALGQACLTSATSPGAGNQFGACASSAAPAPGQTGEGEGYLKLTDAEQNRTGAALYNQPIPASGGLDVTFTQYQYGGSGPSARPNLRADGIGFFLTDGATELTEPGGWGGSLGYAQTEQGRGVRGGYLGVGLDGFGNFANGAFGKGQGCTPAGSDSSPVSASAYEDLLPNTVGIRGPGDDLTGYCFLTATIRRTNDLSDPPRPPQGQAQAAGRFWTTTLPGDLTAPTLDAATRYVHITISAATHPVVTVAIDFDGPGSARGYEQVLSYEMPVAAPPTYKFGFAASTGEHTNVHLIRNLRVESLNPLDQLNLVKQIDHTHDQPESYGAGQEVPYEFVLTNTGQATLTGLTVSDPLVPEISCPVTSLAPAGQPGSSTVCHGSHTVTPEEAATQTELTNRAVARAISPSGAQIDSNESTVSVPVTPHPAIALEKTVTNVERDGATVQPPVEVGDRITYGFTVRNAGNVVLTDATLEDPRLSGEQCATGSLAVGGTTTCTADTHTVTDTDVEGGEIVNTATVSATPESGGGPVEADARATTPTVEARSSIALVKSAVLQPADGSDRTVAEVGDTVTYAFTVTNTGTLTLTGTTVADPKVGQVTCEGTTLAPGQDTTCATTSSYTVTQGDVDAGVVVNTATATGNPPIGEPVTSAADTKVPTAAHRPAIALRKTAEIPGGAEVAQVGDVISYGFTVSNAGNVTLAGVSVTDSALGSVACDDNTLAPGASTTCAGPTRTVVAEDAPELANTAATHATAPDGAEVTDERSALVPVFIAAPSVTLEKRAEREPGDPLPDVGDSITYTYTVTNSGNVPLVGLDVVDDRIPGSIDCEATDLAPGAQAVCTATYVVTLADTAAGSVENTATATATSPGGPVGDTDTETVGTLRPVAGIAVVKSLASETSPPRIGDTLTFDLAVSNTGTVPLSSVTVTDPLADSVTCPAESLAAGATMTCAATVTVTQAQVLAGEVRNTAHAEGTPPGESGLDPVDATDEEAVATVEPVTGLVVDKRADVPGPDPDVVSVRDRIEYQFVVTNTGTLPLTRIAVRDDLLGTVSCPAGNLAPSATTTCSASHVVTQAEIDAGRVVNLATASGTGPGDTRVTSDEDRAEVPTAPANPALTIRKSASLHDEDGDGLADAGETVGYRYVATATGNVSVHDVLVEDDRVRVRCPSATLAPGDSVTCTASGTVTQADVDGGEAVNIATAHATGPHGERVVSPEDRAVVTADSRWDLSVRKAAELQDPDGDGQAAVGEVVVFTTTATNTGTTTLTDIVIDDLDDAKTCTAAALAPGRSLACVARHTTTAADVREGRVRDRSTALGTNPFGYVVGGETSAHAPTVPAPLDQLAATGADLRGPAGAAVAAVVLGALLVWTSARLLRPPPGDRAA